MIVTKQMVDELVELIKIAHEKIIKESGGEQGVRDEGGLTHAAFEILSSIEKHPDKFFYNATVIYRMLATRHYFIDGNKRTSHVTAQTWLLSHGYDFKVDYEQAVPFIISIAQGKSLKEIEEWIKENVVKSSA